MRYYHGISDIIQFEDDTIKSALDTGILRESWRIKLLDKVFYDNISCFSCQICKESF